MKKFAKEYLKNTATPYFVKYAKERKLADYLSCIGAWDNEAKLIMTGIENKYLASIDKPIMSMICVAKTDEVSYMQMIDDNAQVQYALAFGDEDLELHRSADFACARAGVDNLFVEIPWQSIKFVKEFEL